MRLTIVTDNTASVNSKNYWKILDTNIMYNLVKSTL